MMRSIYLDKNVSDPNMITQLDARCGAAVGGHLFAREMIVLFKSKTFLLFFSVDK